MDDERSIISLALYNIRGFGWKNMLRQALSFYLKLNIEPNSIFYSEVVPLDSESDAREVSISEMERIIERNDTEIRGISLSYSKENGQKWDVNFHYYFDDLFSQQSYLIVEYSDEYKKLYDRTFLLDLIKEISSSSFVPYGFACRLPYFGVTSYEYIDAQTVFPKLFPYENPRLWRTEVPSYLNDGFGSKRYLSGLLRLVYPYNIITDKHLEMKVQNISLHDWISSENTKGDLTKINNNLWAWIVKEEYLESVNMVCIDAGLLIAGVKPQTNERVRRTRLP